jgi:hypothetical protein
MFYGGVPMGRIKVVLVGVLTVGMLFVFSPDVSGNSDTEPVAAENNGIKNNLDKSVRFSVEFNGKECYLMLVPPPEINDPIGIPAPEISDPIEISDP